MMTFSIRRFFRIGLVIAALAAPMAGSAQPSSAADSARAGHRNWLSRAARWVLRRSDSTIVVPLDTIAGDTIAITVPTIAPLGDLAIPLRFDSRRDSIAWARTRTLSESDTGFRVIVSLFEHRLRVLDGRDTLRDVPVATAMGTDFKYAGQRWSFDTPRGVRRVREKETEPVWTPPDWHYAEVAAANDLRLAPMGRVSGKLTNGGKLAVQDSIVGLIRPDGQFAELPVDEEIVFDSTLFIPPLGTKNRRIEGELGHFALDLGDGYMLHGTPHKDSIGKSATHGCVRLRDEDIQWLYDFVPVGTRVYIY